ncbi:MAG: hypothetical protein K2O09_00580 [Treponemataceae bacterium]|nr:hypothetical protein [Treponemataceae bacterium]
MASGVKKFLPALCLMLCAALLPADEPKFSQRIEWRANANALEYKVEIQNVATNTVSSFTTEKTFAELSLAPGNYRYRVTVYDFLGRKATTSAWTAFSVIQAAKPEIRRIEKNVTVPDADERLEIAVDIANVSADSVVELVSENVPGELEISGGGTDEKERVSKVYFQDVPPGKWRLRVTNASGFSTESDVIEIVSAVKLPPVEQDAAEVAAARELAERLAREEQEAAERAAREAAALADRLAREEQETAERAAREAAARLAAEKKKKPPYVFKDITVAGGVGLAFMPYDGTVTDMTGNTFAPAFMGRIAAFPLKREKYRFGFELCGSYADWGAKTDFYALNLTFLQIGANVVWKQRLFGEKSFFALKGGGGVVVVDYATTYPYSGDDDRREPSGRKRLFYPAVTAGASLVFNPAQFLSLEAGADFSHLFITGMPTGCVTPYVCVGFRL